MCTARNSGINTSYGLVIPAGISAAVLGGGDGLTRAPGICFDEETRRLLQRPVVFSARSSAVPQLTPLLGNLKQTLEVTLLEPHPESVVLCGLFPLPPISYYSHNQKLHNYLVVVGRI